MINDDTLELFDNYINGTLEDLERGHFEERLRTDEAFRKEFELHKQIVLGVQRKELRAVLLDQEKVLSQPIRRKLYVRVPIITTLAACLLIFIFISHNAFKMASLGEDYIAQLEQPVPRGSGIEETLSLIYDDLQQGNYSDGQENIDKARQLILEEQRATYPTDEETEYHRQMLKLDSDELNWYQALLYAKTHKYFKAKKLLKQIAGSDSRYKDDAAAMLK